MNPAPRQGASQPPPRRASRGVLVLGGLALAAVVLAWLGLGRGFDASVGGAPRQATAIVRADEAPIIFMGNGSQITNPFYLAGGTYRSDWAAWGERPEFPPCTHSAALMAVDPANGETSLGHVTDLAYLVHAPATGASATVYVSNLKPGEYYLDVNSACAWQIGLSPT
jgi:hypothetical protein